MDQERNDVTISDDCHGNCSPRFRKLDDWTGYRACLAQDLANRHDGEGYTHEELVAEIASAFLCASQSITPTARHADYIGAWLAVRRDNARAIFQAASLASKAADYIIGCGPIQPSARND